MKRLGVAIGGLLILLSVFVALNSTASAETTNSWNSNVSVQSGNVLTPTEVINRYDCVYKNAKTIGLNSPFTYLYKAIPIFINPIYTDLGEKCTITNSVGVFTSRHIVTGGDNQIYSEHFGLSTSKMYSLYPTIAGSVWVDPVPKTSKVLVLVRDPGSKVYRVSVYEDFAKGQPEIKNNRLTLSFRNSQPRSFKDKSGLSFKIDEHAFSPNGKYMVIRYKKTVASVNLSTMKMIPVAYERYTVSDELAISNDGRYVALLGGELNIVDTVNCELTFEADKWDYNFYKYSYAGCNPSTNIIKNLKNAGLLENNVYLKRPNFDSNNRSLLVGVGTRKPDTSLNDSRVVVYDWRHMKFTANNHTVQTQGYLALGDSFSSGEGDLQGGDWYEPGTDEQGNKDTFEERNLCHLSRRSYPYLVAKKLGYLGGTLDTPTSAEDTDFFHSIACSGAVIHNVIGGSENTENLIK
jgi:hypothetical protein